MNVLAYDEDRVEPGRKGAEDMIVDMSDVRRERKHSDELSVLDTLVTRGEEVEDTNIDPEVGEDDVEDDVDADTEHQGAKKRETPAARLEPELEVDDGDH